MSNIDAKKQWEDYCQSEIDKLMPILHGLGFVLDKEQVHIGGERYVFFNAQKLVLLGRRQKDGLPVIIKVGSDAKGREEIKYERQCRQMLEKIKFAYHIFFSPREILYQETDARVIAITEYIEQESQFLDRSLLDQFFLALKGLEVQEGAQVTTYEHARDISKHFGVWDSRAYLQKFDQYHRDILDKLSSQKEVLALYGRAREFLTSHIEVIDLYSGFLTHWDFVPHNIRVHGNDIYLLDHSSIRFGNKHESWARLINFMTLHNPDLARSLLFYMQKNRSDSEISSLRAMRVYRLAEIIWHYANTLGRAQGDLIALNQERIGLWSKVLSSVLDDISVDEAVIITYKKLRDSLRSDAEKKRQERLH